MKNNVLLFALGSFLIFSLTSCTKKKIVKKTEEPEEIEDVESEELDIRGKDFVNTKHLAPIRFDYDSDSLSEESRKTLLTNADFLKENDDLEILAEGHCDDRGTIGYNLALGQKRASAVRKYYISLGIKPKRIGSLSFGKEKYVCLENTEECFSVNRRAETKVRALKVANGDKKEKTATEAETEKP